MKRLVISIVLALISLSTAIYSNYDVRTNTRAMTQALNNSIGAIESNADYEQGVSEAIERWKGCRDRFELYLYSEELFDIDLNFSKMEKLLGSDNSEELKELMFENVIHLERLTDNQSPTLKKVF